MKILFAICSYYPDGAGSGTSVRNLAEGCAARGHDVVVVRFCMNEGEPPREETVGGVRILYRRMPNVYPLGQTHPPKWKKPLWHLLDLFNPFAALDFYKILKTEKPDIINTSVIAGFSTSIHVIAKALKIPTVHTMRDYYLICQQNAMFRGGQNCDGLCRGCKPFAGVRRLTSRCVDRFLANSDFVLAQHQKYNAFPKTTPHFAQVNMNESEAIAPPRAFPTSRPLTFGFIGRLDVTKGVESLLAAFQNIQGGAALKIAGSGTPEYERALKNQAAAQDVEFLGHIKAADFYRAIDVLVCPSIYGEPLPRVVYEAYAYGLPVIASNAGGTPEIVDHGKNGFVYAAGDAKALAKYMQDIESDPALYELLSKGACEKAKDFRPSVILDQFIVHLENTIAGTAK